ncbi:MAG: hypothetical protein RLZZ373_2619 [Pseudomonadota bacterium]|jgi:hypothetical protein
MTTVSKSTRKPPTKRGSRKGCPNKVTKALKDMILGALDDAGGQEYLLRQARKKNPAPFLALIAKVLPTTIDGSLDLIDRAAQMRERRERRLAGKD